MNSEIDPKPYQPPQPIVDERRSSTRIKLALGGVAVLLLLFGGMLYLKVARRADLIDQAEIDQYEKAMYEAEIEKLEAQLQEEVISGQSKTVDD